MDGYYSSLKGKRALVTGGAGILAQAMVAGLAQAGADTAAIDCSDHVYATASLAGAVGITGIFLRRRGVEPLMAKLAKLWVAKSTFLSTL